jgi:hypothetical protein
VDTHVSVCCSGAAGRVVQLLLLLERPAGWPGALKVGRLNWRWPEAAIWPWVVCPRSRIRMSPPWPGLRRHLPLL